MKKHEVYKMYQEGATHFQITQATGVPRSTVGHWIQTGIQKGDIQDRNNKSSLRTQVFTLLKAKISEKDIARKLKVNISTVRNIRAGLQEEGLVYKRVIEDILDLKFSEIEELLLSTKLNSSCVSFESLKYLEHGSLQIQFFEDETERNNEAPKCVTLVYEIDELENVSEEEFLKMVKQDFKKGERALFFDSKYAKSGKELEEHYERVLKTYYEEGWSISAVSYSTGISSDRIRKAYRKYKADGLERPERKKLRYYDEPIK